MISVTIPLRTVSEANRRGHWSKHSARTKGQRDAAGLFVLSESLRVLKWHPSRILSADDGKRRNELGAHALLVTLARIAPRTLDDDNLRGALKAVRDGVADALGVDDRDPRVRWEYAQEKGNYGVRIAIEVDPLVKPPRRESRVVREACALLAEATKAIRAGRFR